MVLALDQMRAGVQWPQQASAATCWYLLRGSYCFHLGPIAAMAFHVDAVDWTAWLNRFDGEDHRILKRLASVSAIHRTPEYVRVVSSAPSWFPDACLRAGQQLGALQW